MKKIILSALALLGMGTIANAQFYVVGEDGKILYSMDNGTPAYVTFENPIPCGGVIGEAVDLGLSVKWSSVNLGASNPQDAGGYYAWGETTVKSDYTWDTYVGEPADFNGDNKSDLEAANDAATASWGEEWRMPTASECEELYNNTTQTWTDDYEGTGVKGYIVTSTKSGYEGVSIFLPAAGYRNGSGEPFSVGSYGYYWSSSLKANDSDSGRYLGFRSSGFYPWYGSLRFYGYSVRPVCTGSLK
ncbi:MAG: fibrobacter succinogenes major paralogous domain-containing protein [Bacteroidales bacterium]|nr:fibrobacter succinogenes major paralogous domain-containing protein [Bacteroidales bacterium]